jgi:hypothetical protein
MCPGLFFRCISHSSSGVMVDFQALLCIVNESNEGLGGDI